LNTTVTITIPDGNYSIETLNEYLQSQHDSSPFISKQTVVITDNNPNASYQSGQVVFQTDSLSSNGLYADLRNAVIEIPMVFVVEAITANNTCDFTADADGEVLGQRGLDAILSTKCSDLAFISTLSVELDGGGVVSVTDNIASYLIWRKHDSQGPYSRDELCKYVRDGVNWSIAADGSLRNCSSRREVDTLTQPPAAGANEGMYHRSHNAFTAANTSSVAAVFDDLYITQSNSSKVYAILVIQHASISNGAEGLTHSPNISPFSTATTSPYMLDSFQVRVSGQGIYRDFLNYSYDEYLASIGREGGFMAPFSRREWESGMFRYIVVHLTRKTPDQVNISQSISISGVNQCKKALDVFWFVEQETSITLDVYSGKVIRA
jgi:hypothetical protein